MSEKKNNAALALSLVFAVFLWGGNNSGTKFLVAAAPRPDPRRRFVERPILQGDLPSPVNPPSGCRFRTRCPLAVARCAEEAPLLKDAGGGHLVACHLAG